MATGALIRDFEKQYRELRYANSGSIALSEIEHNAYRAALTLEITHVDAPRYGSRKTLPDNTHYGYVTLFRGSTVTDTIAIKYPKFRVFDIRNQGIWNYHQLTETVLLGGVQTRGILEVLVDGFLPGVFSDAVSWLADSAISWAYDAVSGAWQLIFGESADSGGDGQSASGASDGYRAFPIATPFPDIAKFKADIPCSFLWRLELWYLVNPAVYITDNPTDTGDETEGEDEYPEPEQGDGDGDGDEFPTPSPIPPDSDSRDFDDSNVPPPPPPFEGGQCPGVLYDVTVELSASVFPVNPVTITRQYLGPIRGLTVRSSGSEASLVRQYFVRYGETIQEDLLGAIFVTFNGEANNPSGQITNVSRVDGNPDNCGNPPPIPVG